MFGAQAIRILSPLLQECTESHTSPTSMELSFRKVYRGPSGSQLAKKKGKKDEETSFFSYQRVQAPANTLLSPFFCPLSSDVVFTPSSYPAFRSD